jgi:hypothetical protein
MKKEQTIPCQQKKVPFSDIRIDNHLKDSMRENDELLKELAEL